MFFLYIIKQVVVIDFNFIKWILRRLSLDSKRVERKNTEFSPKLSQRRAMLGRLLINSLAKLRTQLCASYYNKFERTELTAAASSSSSSQQLRAYYYSGYLSFLLDSQTKREKERRLFLLIKCIYFKTNAHAIS